MRRLALPLVLLLSASVLAACGGDDETSAEPSTVTSTAEDGTVTTTTPEPEPVLWPLTGKDSQGKAPTGRRVMVVKMDNTPSSSPQEGLSHADLVVEELVEGGITRLAAFFYSDIPGEVGPIRSMRASDIGIVSPIDATIITSGGAGVTVRRINGADIPFITEGAKGIYRAASGRYAPYNLMANLTDVSKTMVKYDKEIPAYLPFGDASSNPKGVKATSIDADFGNHSTSWEFQKGTYVNTNSFAGEGDHFPADNVLVLRVQIGDAGYRDPAGYPVPETKFEGTGAATLFTGGRAIKGTWEKDGLTDTVSLSTKNGDLVVPPGRTWIELVPAADGNLTFTK